MKIVGILTEFNPFHSGHAYFLAELRRMLGPDCGVVCVMSGNFVQRGAPALLDKHTRAAAALAGGADLILELPVARALSSAEGFARGAVYLMQQSGCVNHLAFGSECGDVDALSSAAACLDTEDFRAALRDFLSRGMPFAACRRAAAETLLGPERAALLDGANNNLGVEYLRAARHLGWDCTAVTVRRAGAGHDSAAPGAYRSGSALRALLCREDWEGAAPFLPETALGLYRAAWAEGAAPVTAERAERMMLARLRTMAEEEFASLPDCAEGLHHRLYDAVRSRTRLDEVLDGAKTRRYAYARLRRMTMCAWLDIDRAAAAELPAYLRVLGFTPRGREILARMRKTARLPVVVKPAGVRRLSEEAQRQFAREARTTDLYWLACPALDRAVPGREWRTGPVIAEQNGE